MYNGEGYAKWVTDHLACLWGGLDLRRPNS